MPRNMEEGRFKLVFSTNADVEAVLAAVKDIVKLYSICTVGDLKQLVSLDTVYSDYSQGWDKFEDVRVDEDDDNFVLSLPTPRAISDLYKETI